MIFLAKKKSSPHARSACDEASNDKVAFWNGKIE